MELFDTIAALATPMGNGGISVIRISGEDAESIAENSVFPISGKTLSALESHKMTLSRVIGRDKNIIDEVLAVVMRAPHSYTGENIVEIHCHGGIMSARLILSELMTFGARMAKPGEFTRRALINGKTDLSRAEAVMDIIDAKGRCGALNAATALVGGLSDKINALRDRVLLITAHLSAAADFPDEVDEIDNSVLSSSVSDLKTEIDSLLLTFERGRLMRDGIRTVILGSPNAGKSSLLNALTREERAIVTDIPGTTRDALEEYINISGLTLSLCDTAGIRESDDAVEKIGIERAQKMAKNADLILFVIDSSREIGTEERSIAEMIGKKNTIVLLNKQDKKTILTKHDICKILSIDENDILPLSLKAGEKCVGIELLEKKIEEKFLSGKIAPGDVCISNERQRDSLIKAKQALCRVESAIASDFPKDLLYVDLEDTVSALGEITGETVQEEIIDRVFENFCVGK